MMKSMKNSKLRLLVIGSSGYIGQYLIKLKLPYQAIFTFYSNKLTNGLFFDLKKDSLTPLINKNEITHVLFLGGIVNFSKINKNKAEAKYINVDCTISRLKEVINCGAIPIFFSSESVFSGESGNYSESDKPSPVFEYGLHKQTVEEYIKKNTDRYYILRLSKVFSSDPEPQSLVTSWLHQLENNQDILVATDNVFNPIHIEDLKNFIESVVAKGDFGIYHLCSPKPMARSEMLDMVMSEYLKYKFYYGAIIRKKLHDIKGAEMLPINTSMSSKKVENLAGYSAQTFAYWSQKIVYQYFQ